MIIPIRCYSCGKPIGHLWEEYKKKIEKDQDKKKALNDLGLDKYCCRSLFLGHVDLIDTAAEFKKAWLQKIYISLSFISPYEINNHLKQ